MPDCRWVHESRRTVVCVDSYEDGVLKGRVYNAYAEPECFESLSQFLIKMESLLDELQQPQSATKPRSFATFVEPMDYAPPLEHIRRGAKATFEVQVIFRQHTSWQGVVIWLEQQMEQSFRSVLELILLMDSALRSRDESIRAS